MRQSMWRESSIMADGEFWTAFQDARRGGLRFRPLPLGQLYIPDKIKCGGGSRRRKCDWPEVIEKRPTLFLYYIHFWTPSLIAQHSKDSFFAFLLPPLSCQRDNAGTKEEKWLINDEGIFVPARPHSFSGRYFFLCAYVFRDFSLHWKQRV